MHYASGLTAQSIPISPEPNDPVPLPITTASSRSPIRRLMKSRLNCRIRRGDLRGYAPADRLSFNTRIHCDRFFYPDCFTCRPISQP